MKKFEKKGLTVGNPYVIMFTCSRETKSTGSADRLTPKPNAIHGRKGGGAYAVQDYGSYHDPNHRNNDGKDRENHAGKRKHHDARNHRSAGQ